MRYRSAGWNLNPKQICVFTFEQETQNEVMFISQLDFLLKKLIVTHQYFI